MTQKHHPSGKSTSSLSPKQIELINETAMLRLAEQAIALGLIKRVSKRDNNGKVHIAFGNQLTRVFELCCAHHFLMGLLFYWHHNQTTKE